MASRAARLVACAVEHSPVLQMVHGTPVERKMPAPEGVPHFILIAKVLFLTCKAMLWA